MLEAAAREILNMEPSDAWARRERALALSRLQRGEQALAEGEEAVRIEPGSSFSYSVLALVLRRLGRTDDARVQLQRAVFLNADHEEAIHSLLELAGGDAERREALAFVERELVRQVVTGDGLLADLEKARPFLEPEAVLGILR